MGLIGASKSTPLSASPSLRCVESVTGAGQMQEERGAMEEERGGG